MNGIAHTTAAALTAQGFNVTEIGNASTQLAAGGPSEILYGPSGIGGRATRWRRRSSGPVTLVPDASLSGQTVSLLIAGSQLTVTGSSTGAATTTTTTTTTPTTIPADVYTNTQPEPWNPSPCTIGQATQATPTTSAHKAVKKK